MANVTIQQIAGGEKITPVSTDTVELQATAGGVSQFFQLVNLHKALTVATTLAKGVMSAADKTKLDGVPLLNTAQEWTATQNFNATGLTDGANIGWDASANQVCSVTLAGNRTLDNPTNMKDGATYIVTVKQDATGSRTLAYGTAYLWPGGTAPTLSTAANAIDIITFISDGTSMYGVINQAFA